MPRVTSPRLNHPQSLVIFKQTVAFTTNMRGGGTAGGGKRGSSVTFTRQIPKFLRAYIPTEEDERSDVDVEGPPHTNKSEDGNRVQETKGKQDHGNQSRVSTEPREEEEDDDDETNVIDDMRRQGFRAEVVDHDKDGERRGADEGEDDKHVFDSAAVGSKRRMVQVGEEQRRTPTAKYSRQQTRGEDVFKGSSKNRSLISFQTEEGDDEDEDETP